MKQFKLILISAALLLLTFACANTNINMKFHTLKYINILTLINQALVVYICIKGIKNLVRENAKLEKIKK